MHVGCRNWHTGPVTIRLQFTSLIRARVHCRYRGPGVSDCIHTETCMAVHKVQCMHACLYIHAAHACAVL